MPKKKGDPLKELGQRIKKIREEKGIAQANCGINGRTMRRIESGEHNPTYLVLLKVANALHVKVADLLPDH